MNKHQMLVEIRFLLPDFFPLPSQSSTIKEISKLRSMMSPLLEKVLAEVTQLDRQEQLQLVSYLITQWQQQPNLFVDKKISRKSLFGCMQGKIKIAEDFNAPLNDFSEYM
ncbi:hypothetical protein [Arthrospira sp. PCC 8006]